MLNIYGSLGFASCALFLARVVLVRTALLIMQAIPQAAASAAVFIARRVDGAAGLRWVLKRCR